MINQVKANLAESDRSLAEGQSSIAQKLANVEDFLEEFKSSSDTQIRDINKENGSILVRIILTGFKIILKSWVGFPDLTLTEGFL